MPDPPPTPEPAGKNPAGESQQEPLAGEVPRAGAAPPTPVPAAAKPAAAGKPAESVRSIAPPSGPPDPPPPPATPLPTFLSALQAALPGAVAHVSLWGGDWSI